MNIFLAHIQHVNPILFVLQIEGEIVAGKRGGGGFVDRGGCVGVHISV